MAVRIARLMPLFAADATESAVVHGPLPLVVRAIIEHQKLIHVVAIHAIEHPN